MEGHPKGGVAWRRIWSHDIAREHNWSQPCTPGAQLFAALLLRSMIVRNFQGIHLTAQLSKVVRDASKTLYVPFIYQVDGFGPNQFAHTVGRGAHWRSWSLQGLRRWRLGGRSPCIARAFVVPLPESWSMWLMVMPLRNLQRVFMKHARKT